MISLQVRRWNMELDILVVLVLIGLMELIRCQDQPFKFVIVIEEEQEFVNEWLTSQDSTSIVLSVNHTTEDISKICGTLDENQETSVLFIDATWSGSEWTQKASSAFGFPYVRVDISIGPVLELLDRYLVVKNTSDVVVIFESSKLIDQALYFWIDSTKLRMVIADKLDEIVVDRLKGLRPLPNSWAIVASSSTMADMFQLASRQDMVSIPERWNLVFLDVLYESFPNEILVENVTLLKIDRKTCCESNNYDVCTCPDNFMFQKTFFGVFLEQIRGAAENVFGQLKIERRVPNCGSIDFNATGEVAEENPTVQNFLRVLSDAGNATDKFLDIRGVYRPNLKSLIERTVSNKGDLKIVARYDGGTLDVVDERGMQPVKPFYRVGITYAIPWTYEEKDPTTGRIRWTGYCIDLIQKLSERLDFDYELVVPENGTFGERDENGKWDGLIGDIARGETDFAIGAIVMRADREEIVDFVPPYYDQSGITIVMRKPTRKTSLFRFMTVLKLEVWLSIVAALVVTAFMMWFLDKYSPYSAKNNKTAYPYPCRDFSLKECFWFALTSFTPQGGGETPKSLSARTLVTAYWLFVVLMLATFTANLAAFLTVERMQTPVQSLEQLARQSRINYTVVEGSDTHQYFMNMKFAEDTLYRMWKELTLNASPSEVQYRVWDYPIREQYSHILLAINDSMPLSNASEGFRIVNERLEGDFAFIHDSSEVKYEISKNCNLTEIGEVFAEKPYAVVVQQGSYLSDPIGIQLLDLQKDRYFEELRSKYWNYSSRGECKNDDEEEGITLESLGGVFIATIFGLVLALVTLGLEVTYYKRKNKVSQLSPKGPPPKEPKKKKNYPATITIGSQFKPLSEQRLTPKISTISVYPRSLKK